MKNTTQTLRISKLLTCLIMLILALSVITACYKDSQEVVTTTKPDETEVIVSGDVVIQVADETGAIPAGVTLEFDGQNADITGPYTHFPGTDIDKYHEIALVRHPEYGVTPFHVESIENDVSYAHVALYTNRDTRTFPGDAAATFELHGLKVHMDHALLLNTQPYMGEAKWSGFSTDINTNLALFPGGRIGYDPQEVPGFLTPYALSYIGARTTDNTELSFAPGKVNLTIPGTCNSCMVWHMDQEGVWHEVEGVTFDSGMYSLDAPGSGYYCIADWQPAVRVTGGVVADGVNIQGIQLRFMRDGKLVANTTTSNTGKWEAQLPANAALDIGVITVCDTQAAGYLETTMQSGTLPAIDLSGKVAISKVHGIARDCADQPLSSHYLTITGDNGAVTLYYPDGEFHATTVVCNNVFSVQSFTPDWSEQGPEVTWNAKPELNLHSTYACSNALNEYLTIRINGDQKIYWNAQSSLTVNQRTQIIAEDVQHPDAECSIWISGMDAGAFDDMQLNILYEDRTLSYGGYSLYCPTSSAGCGFETFEITHFGNTGEWIRGYFSGTFWVKTYQPLTAGSKKVEGEFQIYRDF